jgi:hypothetical protein
VTAGRGAASTALLTEIPVLDSILSEHVDALAGDLHTYRNHTYRVVNLCAALAESGPEALEKIAIAAAFHDLGIWTDGTWDYLPPSIRRAGQYLAATGRSAWTPEISTMILEHHKVTRYRGGAGLLVETFRRADWVDVTWGVVRFGLDRTYLRSLHERWPALGFHAMLLRRTLQRWKRHPLSPLPMFRL